MNMYKWIDRLIYQEDKKAFPLLSFPSVQLLYVTVKELVTTSNYQALGMKMLADKYPMPAVASFMDLSVEAEAFGARTVYAADEVPTIIGKIVETQEDADDLQIPPVGAGRTGIYIEGVRKALKLITDRPVFAGCAGPFSLAGRLAEALPQLGSPSVVVTGADMAKALGQALATRLTGPLLCLDGLELPDGSFLDVAAPVAAGTAYPVVKKTLVLA